MVVFGDKSAFVGAVMESWSRIRYATGAKTSKVFDFGSCDDDRCIEVILYDGSTMWSAGSSAYHTVSVSDI